jgi:hypothetical protein
MGAHLRDRSLYGDWVRFAKLILYNLYILILCPLRNSHAPSSKALAKMEIDWALFHFLARFFCYLFWDVRCDL